MSLSSCPKPPLYVITGPTAAGKSAIAFEMAKKLNCTIISADSLQVYKHLNIGTAKPTEQMMNEVVHHCVDELEITEEYNAFLFRNRAAEIKKENDIQGVPTIICGGTGLFIDAFIYNFSCSLPTDKSLRAKLQKQADEEGVESLYTLLKQKDPNYAMRITKGDRQKILRALEVISLSGQSFSALQQEQNKKKEASLQTELRYIVVTQEREQLYERINMRVNKMFEEGLLEEVQSLSAAGYNRNLKPLKSIGYRELFSYLAGECSLKRAREEIQKNSRHLAKRQLTWHRRKEFAEWIDSSNLTLEEVINIIFTLKTP